MDPYKKIVIIAIATVMVLLCAYLGSYAYVRHERVSAAYVRRQLVIAGGSPSVDFYFDPSGNVVLINPDDYHLDYADSPALYLIFWPAIQVDSRILGLEIDSPFGIVPYRVPKGYRVPTLKPAVEPVNP